LLRGSESLGVAATPERESTFIELGALVRLAVPIAIAQLGLVAMSLVDTAAIGRVSVDDLAGAGIGRSIGFGTAVVGIGLAGALDPLAAQAVGAGDPGRAWQAFVTTLRATLLLWPALMVAAFAVTLTLPAVGLDAAVISRVRLYIAGQAPGFAAKTPAIMLPQLAHAPDASSA